MSESACTSFESFPALSLFGSNPRSHCIFFVGIISLVIPLCGAFLSVGALAQSARAFDTQAERWDKA
jgi:hypothetical protein